MMESAFQTDRAKADHHRRLATSTLDQTMRRWPRGGASGRAVLGCADNLSDTPDDSGDMITILIDADTVIGFELPRIHFKEPRLVGGPPRDVHIETLAHYRQRIGQGKQRIFLDKAVADARLLIAENGI